MLFVGGLMYYLRCLCLFVHSGVCFFFFFFFFLLCLCECIIYKLEKRCENISYYVCVWVKNIHKKSSIILFVRRGWKYRKSVKWRTAKEPRAHETKHKYCLDCKCMCTSNDLLGNLSVWTKLDFEYFVSHGLSKSLMLSRLRLSL